MGNKFQMRREYGKYMEHNILLFVSVMGFCRKLSFTGRRDRAHQMLRVAQYSVRKIINQHTLSFSFALNAPDAGNKLEGHFSERS